MASGLTVKFVGSQDVPAFICVGAQAKDKAALIYIYIYMQLETLTMCFHEAARASRYVLTRGQSPSKLHRGLLEPRPRFEGKALKFEVVCPLNGTAVLKGLRG